MIWQMQFGLVGSGLYPEQSPGSGIEPGHPAATQFMTVLEAVTVVEVVEVAASRVVCVIDVMVSVFATVLVYVAV